MALRGGILVFMADFPHLEGVTPFPFNQTPPAPYEAYRNTFDFTRWDAGTVVKLCAVPWDGGNDVVKWENDAARDAYFAGLDGYEATLQTPAQITGHEVKIPLPTDMSALYNYAWVAYPSPPIDGENADTGVHKWGFFIDAIEYRAPSATALTIRPDLWTTFINRVTIPAVRLEQGHWAVANSATPADYLADPLAHTANLLDNEGDTLSSGLEARDLTSDFWNTGDQLAVIDTGLTNPAGDYTVAMPTLARSQTVGGQPAGHMTAINPSQLSAFLNAAPAGLIASIKALYIAPRRLLSLGTSSTLYGATVWPVIATTEIKHDINLTPAAFAYPEPADKWAKLYTGQYTRLVMQTNTGQTVSVPVEQTGASAVLRVKAAAADGLAITAYLAGIGTDTPGTVTLQRLDTAAAAPTGGTWQATLATWNIPAYRVQISAADLTAWQKSYSRANDRARAYAALLNARASADTGKTNADASADTAKANTTRSTDVSVANTTRSVNTSTANQTLSNQLTEDTTNLAINVANEANWLNIDNNINLLGASGLNRQVYGNLGTYTGDRPTGSALDVLISNATLDYNYTARTYSVTREAGAEGLAATAISNAISGAAGIATNQDGVSGLVMGGLDALTSPTAAGRAGAAAGTALGGAGMVAGAAAGFIGTSLNFGVTVQKEDAMQDAARTYQVGDGAIGAGGKTGVAVNQLLYENQQSRKLARSIQVNENGRARAALNGGTFLDTTVRHGTLATATSINTNNGDTANTNAAASKTATDSNATATQSTTKENATRSRDTAKANAQRTYDAALATVTAGINTDARGVPPIIAPASGDAATWGAHPVGVTIRIERPLDGDLLRIADRFNARGYKCARLVKNPELLQMPEWTYWQCARAVVKPAAAGAPLNALQWIAARLENGVTVWRAPDMIGDVEQ